MPAEGRMDDDEENTNLIYRGGGGSGRQEEFGVQEVVCISIALSP